jgi:hypothetical protein
MNLFFIIIKPYPSSFSIAFVWIRIILIWFICSDYLFLCRCFIFIIEITFRRISVQFLYPIVIVSLFCGLIVEFILFLFLSYLQSSYFLIQIFLLSTKILPYFSKFPSPASQHLPYISQHSLHTLPHFLLI